MVKRLVILLTLIVAHLMPTLAQEVSDNDRLDMAIAYFQSGKYHEALLLFEKLDKEYALNPRFHAYMGVCYYSEWLYEEACRYLDEAIPQLEAFAPHERSVYYYTNGESHFQLQQYLRDIYQLNSLILEHFFLFHSLAHVDKWLQFLRLPHNLVP